MRRRLQGRGFLTHRRRLLPVLIAALWGASPADAKPPQLALTVDCAVGEVCFVQNYVDHDSAPGWRDHACGRLSYDGHDGTDIRLPDYVMMDKGVAVLAAAAGTVLRVRDGMADVSVREIGPRRWRGATPATPLSSITATGGRRGTCTCAAAASPCSPASASRPASAWA